MTSDPELDALLDEEERIAESWRKCAIVRVGPLYEWLSSAECALKYRDGNLSIGKKLMLEAEARMLKRILDTLIVEEL